MQSPKNIGQLQKAASANRNTVTRDRFEGNRPTAEAVSSSDKIESRPTPVTNTQRAPSRPKAGSMTGYINPNRSGTIALKNTHYDSPRLKKPPSAKPSTKGRDPGLFHNSRPNKSGFVTDYRGAGRSSKASRKVLKSLKSGL